MGEHCEDADTDQESQETDSGCGGQIGDAYMVLEEGSLVEDGLDVGIYMEGIHIEGIRKECAHKEGTVRCDDVNSLGVQAM